MEQVEEQAGVARDRLGELEAQRRVEESAWVYHGKETASSRARLEKVTTESVEQRAEFERATVETAQHKEARERAAAQPRGKA